jgi:uncharacterized membrane protein
MSHPSPRTGYRLSDDPWLWLLVAAMLGYIMVFTALAWDLHAGMRTHKADLGQIAQAVWNSSRGNWLAQTDNGFEATRLTDHVEPILILISPILYLWNDLRVLLFLQVAAVAVGALPLYALANRRLLRTLTREERQRIWEVEPLQSLTRPLAFLLGLAWLLAPQLQSAVLTEFHAAPLAAPLILWALWAIESGRRRQAILAVLLTALVKEEVALLAAGLGLWMAWRAWWESRQGEALTGLGLALLCTAWFWLSTFVIVPTHAAALYGTAESSYFQRFGALGDSPSQMLRSIVTNPRLVLAILAEPPRLAYLFGLVAPFGLLSLLAPELLLLSLPVLLANVLSAYPAQYYGDFHYSAPLLAFTAAAAAFGLARLWRWITRLTRGGSPAFQHLPAAGAGVMAAASLAANPRTAVRPLLAGLLALWLLAWSGGYYLQHGRGPGGARHDPPPITAHHLLLERFTAQIPATARVTATAAVHPHVALRRYVYQFPLGLAGPEAADWALLDVTTNTDMAPGDLKSAVDAMLAGDWWVVDGADGFLLLTRAAAEDAVAAGHSKAIPPAFLDFARTPGGDDGGAADAIGEPLRLTGLAVEDWPRWRQTKVTPTWLVGPGFNATDDTPALSIRTPDGATLYTLGSATPPTLVWYPPEAWQPGDSIRATTLWLFLPRISGVEAGGAPPEQLTVLQRGQDGTLSLHEMTGREFTPEHPLWGPAWNQVAPVPDQACALIGGPVCASQPLR